MAELEIGSNLLSVINLILNSIMIPLIAYLLRKGRNEIIEVKAS